MHKSQTCTCNEKRCGARHRLAPAMRKDVAHVTDLRLRGA
jgi:hypothetical protein